MKGYLRPALFLTVLVVCLFLMYTYFTRDDLRVRPLQAIDMRSQVYFPLVFQGQALVGVEWFDSAPQAAAWHVKPSPVRLSCRWSEVNQLPGVFDWSTCDTLIGNYHPYLLTIKMTPDWAKDFWQPTCKLPKREFWDDFANFVNLAQARYQPHLVEVWNEPDFRLEDMQASDTTHFGCLGPGQGAYYGEFITYLAEHTQSHLAVGAVVNIDNDFLGDMLETAIGFEVITFHCYAGFYGALYDPCPADFDLVSQLWPQVILSETGVIYKYGEESNYYQAQVDHFHNLVDHLPTPWFWFTLTHNGWPVPISTDMLNRDRTPRPVYWEYLKHYE